MSSSSSIPRIQVFRPTMEEFKNFSKYIEKMEEMGAHKAGLAKIIPPEGWCPRKGGYNDIDLMIPAPIRQVVNGRQGLYQQFNVQLKAMHVKEFKKMAENSTFKTPSHFDYEDLERKYWKNITFNTPIYGADVSGSLYDKGVEEFNIQHLNTILDLVKEDYEIQIEGVNTAYLYFGMWKTTFAWHTEDMDLYSINYLHFGAPKSWYVVPPEHGRRLERLASGFFHDSHQLCGAFLRHKMTIISPHILKKFSIPCSKITQEPGEFMITFPFGYHSGFNHGFNCAESTNFALPRWIEYGKRSSQCTCRNDCVKICMDVFVRKFQPERYDLWKLGKDVGSHPEEPNKLYAAPIPNKLEHNLNVKKEKKKPEVKQKIKRHPVSKLDKLQNKRRKELGLETSDEEYESMLGCDEPKKTQKKKRVKKLGISVKVEPVEGKSCSDTDESATQLLDMKSEETETDSPPELKPFWDPEEKIKLDSQATYFKTEFRPFENQDNIIKSDVSAYEANTSNYYHTEAEIIDKFPQLKNAVNHGSLSVVLVDDDCKPKADMSLDNDYVTVASGDSENTASFYNFELSNSIFNQNWRCEQINNGLKIKFVSPKHSQSALSTEFPKIASVGECSVSYTSEEITVKTENPLELSSVDEPHTKEYMASGDSGQETNPRIKRAANSKDNWAHPLTGLWQHEKYNFEIECNYNKKLASVPPHCAICIIFTPLLNHDKFPFEPSNVPSFSRVKMPSFCYGNSLNSECILDTNSLLRSDGTSPLLSCSNCKVCVHASCYGISVMPLSPWICSRCSEKAMDAQCCLCVLRGGALKPTTDGRWAHIVCAVLISEACFENTQLKEPIDVSKITNSRKRLKCKYCMKAHALKDRRGICVQCLSGKCYLPFHVTCGYMAGVIFESCDWPEPIKIMCTKHTAARRKPIRRHFTNVSVGQSVIAKHKNKRYYWAKVKQKYIQEYYSVLFEDNSTSTDVLPEDIVSKDVAIYGCPEMNEKIKIKWTDDKIYNGIFKGSQSIDMFVIEFDDETTQQQERKQIYAADEELPREVRYKMSHSSEGRNLNIVTSENSGKRSRLCNQKYFSV